MKQSSHDHLDNPIWFALMSRQAHLRQSSTLALRYHPEVAPFGAVEETTPEALKELASLATPGGPVAILARTPLPQMDGVSTEQVGVICQMIAPGDPPDDARPDVVNLGEADVADMLALTQLTKPGPFAQRTIEMGNYIGIRHQGQLIAMAGERMKVQGHTEISAVCVDPAHQGKGWAGRLMNILRREVLLRGETPFLHVFEHNVHAIKLYEKLGFTTRQTFFLCRITPT